MIRYRGRFSSGRGVGGVGGSSDGRPVTEIKILLSEYSTHCCRADDRVGRRLERFAAPGGGGGGRRGGEGGGGERRGRGGSGGGAAEDENISEGTEKIS